MNFTKMQGAGNDFVMIRPEGKDVDWCKLAKNICDRHYGVGADGIILVLPSKIADVRMRIFNPDGSEAETCGNGLRCLAKYAVLNKIVHPDLPQITVETIPGVRTINLGYLGAELTMIQVGIGVPKFKAQEIPVNIDLKNAGEPILYYPMMVDDQQFDLTFVSMGNPHAVCFTDKGIKGFPLQDIGPQIENNTIFPKRVNFEIARVINREKIEMRVWERGAGETLACGTGACAVAVAAQIHQYVGNKVDIIMPGGTLNIEWDGMGEVLMSGPAEVVFTGVWSQ